MLVIVFMGGFPTTQTDLETTIQTDVATEVSASAYTSISAETGVSTITEYTTFTRASRTSVLVVTKRAVVSIPTLLGGYSDSSLDSACSKAATSPGAVVILTTTTTTATQTSHMNTTTTAVSVVTVVSSTREQSLTTFTSTFYSPPLPTQVVVNPSFEIGGIPGSSGQLSPWVNGRLTYTQESQANYHESFDGTWFTVLYSPVSTLSQILADLAPGTTYTLQYHYRLYKVSNNEGTEMLTASIGGQVVDTLSVTDLTPLVPYYVSRRATYVATADTATLVFEVAGTTLVSFVLDDITLTVV